MPSIWPPIFIERGTMRNVRKSGLAFAIAMIAGLCAVKQHGADASPAVHRIMIEKMAFGPSPANVHPGDTVVWVNDDIFRHSATADDGGFDVDIEPHATASIVVKRPGRFAYICKYHPGMKGLLIVDK